MITINSILMGVLHQTPCRAKDLTGGAWRAALW